MDKTVCKTYFFIEGEFNLEEITNVLEIENTGGHSIGQGKRYGSGVYSYALWEYGTDYKLYQQMNKQNQ